MKSLNKSFPAMRRERQALSQEACIEILKKEPRGVMALYDVNGYPYTVVLNHYYADGRLYFHGAKQGCKMEILKQNPKVCFCVMDQGTPKPNHWSLNFQSVVVFGEVKFITDPQETKDWIYRFGKRYYPVDQAFWDTIKNCENSLQMFYLEIHHMMGKLVNES